MFPGGCAALSSPAACRATYPSGWRLYARCASGQKTLPCQKTYREITDKHQVNYIQRHQTGSVILDTAALTEKSGHLAWCALIARHLARQDGNVISASQESLFITRWLATALKQRRFARDVAPVIEWLLKQGRAQGHQAALASKLEYLWLSCTGELSMQNDLFRLTYALETAKTARWIYRVLSDQEWSGRYAISLNDGVNGVYLSRSSLDVAFNDDGQQTRPLLARLTGSVPGFEQLLLRCGWQLQTATDIALPFVYRLIVSPVSPETS